MPPVSGFSSANSVAATICSPSEAATKYSPRTRSAGSARHSDSPPAITAATRQARKGLGTSSSATCAPP